MVPAINKLPIKVVLTISVRQDYWKLCNGQNIITASNQVVDRTSTLIFLDNVPEKKQATFGL